MIDAYGKSLEIGIFEISVIDRGSTPIWIYFLFCQIILF